jgi:hypothetical protein
MRANTLLLAGSAEVADTTLVPSQQFSPSGPAVNHFGILRTNSYGLLRMNS